MHTYELPCKVRAACNQHANCFMCFVHNSILYSVGDQMLFLMVLHFSTANYPNHTRPQQTILPLLLILDLQYLYPNLHLHCNTNTITSFVTLYALQQPLG